MNDYGILCADHNGSICENLEAALAVEGVLLLGGGRSGIIELDALFPLREHFGGIFVMPLAHAFAANTPTEHAVAVYFDKGRLVWRVPYQADNMYSGMPWTGGEFAGRQFLYGYWNK
ncbi:hypothetical protein [Conchiformibius kuhniae]|uniref:Uncharacterized protein n=1 Tax=Conchiformibius kuhniae TaxID=211502 RepID=A0A8T9MW33_9NEIS|nr:hypothetical protein [Conchiformibius kuhniae]UOP05354.1 hypothetical protein LVJ77_03930 [Conchiformibius kuhniae]